MALPPDLKALVDDFLSAPSTREHIQRAAAVAREFFTETVREKGVFLALAEVEDRDTRIALAQTLRDLYATARKGSAALRGSIGP